MFLKDYAKVKSRSSRSKAYLNSPNKKAVATATTKRKKVAAPRPLRIKMRYWALLILISLLLIVSHGVIINSAVRLYTWQKQLRQSFSDFWKLPSSENQLVTVEFHPPRE